jgi:hypothetical protein
MFKVIEDKPSAHDRDRGGPHLSPDASKQLNLKALRVGREAVRLDMSRQRILIGSSPVLARKRQ